MAGKIKENEYRGEKQHRLFGETLAAALGTVWSPHVCLHYEDAAAHILSPPLRPDPATPTELMKLLAA